jgi:hypothetical protein
MPKRTFYLKGYKLDREKIRHTFPKEDGDPDENYELLWYQPIINQIPETVYKYVGGGVEADGHLNLLLVLEDGYDKAPLTKGDFKPEDETLAMIAKEVLTFGIWPDHEQDDEDLE